MAEIINMLKYQIQKFQKNNPNEEELANKVLDLLNYNNHETKIPIAKITRSYGLEIYQKQLDKKTSGIMSINVPKQNQYHYNQIIILNKKVCEFEKRVIIAQMLGHYLINIINDKRYQDQNISSEDILPYDNLYDQYEDFILNVLAPNQIFIDQYKKATKAGLENDLLHAYLSGYFAIPDEFVYRKMLALIRK